MPHNPRSWTALLHKHLSCFQASNSHSNLLTYWLTVCVCVCGQFRHLFKLQSRSLEHEDGKMNLNLSNKINRLLSEQTTVRLATADFDQHARSSTWFVYANQWSTRKCRFVIWKVWFIAKGINHNPQLSAAYNWQFSWIINTWIWEVQLDYTYVQNYFDTVLHIRRSLCSLTVGTNLLLQTQSHYMCHTAYLYITPPVSR